MLGTDAACQEPPHAAGTLQDCEPSSPFLSRLPAGASRHILPLQPGVAAVVAVPAKKGEGGRDAADGKDGGEGGGLMTPADLRAALKRSGRKPASCVIGLTKDRQAVILLHRLKRPRKLLGEAKAQAKAAGLVLDLATLRFGRVSVSGGSDSAQAGFVVNKPGPPAVQQAMRAPMRAAGHPRFTVNADPSLEDEADDSPDEVDGDGDGDGDDADLDGDGTGGGATPRPAATATGGAAASAGAATGAAAPAGPLAPPPPGAASGPPAGPGGASRAGSPDAALRARLTPLVRRVSAAVKSGQPGSERLLAAAEAAHGALTSGDLAAAGGGADALERLLGGPAAPTGAAAAGGGGAPPPASPAGAAPAPAADGVAAPGTPAPGGAAPPGAGALKEELAGLVGRIAPAVAADPSRKGALLKLANDVNARRHAGDLAGTQAGIAALRQALPPAAGTPGGPPADAGTDADAMMQGADARRAAGTGAGAPGNWQVAGGSPAPAMPPAAAAGGGPTVPAGGPRRPGMVGRALRGVVGRVDVEGWTARGAAAGGIGGAVVGGGVGGTAEGLGGAALGTAVAPGVGTFAGAVAGTADGALRGAAVGGAAGAVVLGGAANLAARAINYLEGDNEGGGQALLLPPATAPAGQQPAAPPAPGSLAGARVGPGPLGMPGAMPAGPAAVASTDGAGTTQVRTGGIAAMTSLDPSWAGALDRPGPAAPPLVLPPEGFDIHPDAGKPTVVSTPLPDPSLAPSHTGSPPVTVNPGDLRESFPALQPQGPTIMESSGPFSSNDPLVGDLANEIEAAKPGFVKGVNVDLFKPDGTKATDIDIQVDGATVQVKSGSGAGLTRQMNTTKQLTGLRAIAYGPELGPTLQRSLRSLGFEVYTKKEDLLRALGVGK